MDIFGIGNALKGTASTYYLASRRTGRTTMMIESVRDGDRIIFSDNKEARRVERLLKERNLDVECRVLIIGENDKLKFGTAQGRTIFDHSWVEQFYLYALKQTESEIDFIQKELSGYGLEHFETKRQAIEMAKFNPAG